MLFTSFPFIVFLAIVVVASYLAPKRGRVFVLLAANVIFYAFAGWRGMICVAFTCLVSWYAGMRIEKITMEGAASKDSDKAGSAAGATGGAAGKSNAVNKEYLKLLRVRKRKWMLAAVLVNLAVLAVFKYAAGATVGPLSIVMPMGISFYTFKALSYVIDAYRSKTPDASRGSLLKVALYISWFPEIVQGPLSRFGDIGATLFVPNDFEPAVFSQGLRRVCFGFFKKLIIADRLLPAVFLVTASPDEYHASYILLSVFLYSIALYADFTGGIDIAIGAASMMGVRTKENFNSPYFAKSIMDYWRRWHITMGAWFRDYLYYPLSSSKLMSVLTKPVRKRFGQKQGAFATAIIVTMILWLSIGLWHGASWGFIAWGLANGVVIVIHQALMGRYEKFAAASPFAKTKFFGAVQIVLTFILMSFINNIDLYSLKDVIHSFGRIFSGELLSGFLAGGAEGIGLGFSDCLASVMGVVVMVIAGGLSRSIFKDKEWTVGACLVQCGALCLAVLVFGRYGMGYEARQFVYNQF